MRSSAEMLTNYLNKDNKQNIQETITEITPSENNNIIQIKQHKPRDRSQYLEDYYEANKQKIKDMVKENDKKNYNN